MGKARPKILFLSHSPHLGGAERCLHVLLQGMPRDRFDISVLMPRRGLIGHRGRQDLGRLISQLDIPVHRTPIRWWAGKWPRYPAFALGLAKRVAKVVDFLQKNRVDLVVSNTSVFVEGALAARACGIPHVWHVLEMLEHDPGLRPVVPLPEFHRLMDQLSRHIITVSNAVKRELEQNIAPEKIRVVHTGLPASASRAMRQPKQTMFDLPPDTPVVTFVGLLSERKRAVDLVDAASTVLKQFPRTTFVIAGPDGGEGPKIAKKIREYRLGPSFRMLGYRQDIPDILAASDMLVLPSLADPLPLAVLEAMNIGIPVIGTRSGGCEEMIVDGKTGYLTPSKSPDSLAHAIIALLKNPNDRVQMGQAGHQHLLEHFSYPQYISNFDRVLEETLAATAFSADANATEETQSLIAQLRASAFQQARLQAGGENCGSSRCRDYVEAIARCLSIL